MEEIKNNDLLEVWDNIFLMHDWGKYPEGNLIRFVANNFYQKNNPGHFILWTEHTLILKGYITCMNACVIS